MRTLQHRLPPKRPYFAQDSGGYITSRNDIPLLSLSRYSPAFALLPSPRTRGPLIPHSLLPEIAGYTTIIFARPTPPPLFFRHAVTCPAVYFDVAVPHPSLRNKYPSYLPTLNNYRRTGVIPVRSRKTEEKKILFFTSTLSRIYAIREGEGSRS